VRDTATLPLLAEVKAGDYVVLELDSWQMQGFGESKISPHVAVFTNLMEDHKNYYKDNPAQYFEDKANIFKYQTGSDFLIVGEGLQKVESKSKQVAAKASNVSKDWRIKLIGEHNLENIACATEAGRALGISEEDIKKGVESFDGVEGRLQFVREINGVKIYNDNNATTPEATIAALKALDSAKTVLICGGTDKGLELSGLIQKIINCKNVIMLPGTGSDRLDINARKVDSLKDAVDKALEVASSGDTILFSPAFASFGLFKNEYERNDKFLDIVKGL
jgi:UDP-N-acetylmuramoylalanine--D-glutamate ligase